MGRSRDGARAGMWNPWRIGRWLTALALVLTPLAMMQVVDGWHWTLSDFVVAGGVIGGVLLLYELAERVSSSRAYRGGVAIALASSFLTVWSTIVRDDPGGLGFFLVILAAGVAAFATRLQAAGLARGMLGVAIMQLLLCLAIATAPSTRNLADGGLPAMAAGGVFTTLWLMSAALFQVAARRDPNDGARRQAGT